MDVIAICDHNSARNLEATRHAGEREGVAVIGGIEITSEEEVHVIGLFDDEQSLCDLERLVDQHLRGENNPELFGDQSLCDEHDAVCGSDPRLLIGATTLTVEEVVEAIHKFGGLAIASHVDRESFSIFSQLGLVPEELQIDAMEVSPLHTVAEARTRFPELAHYPLIRSSDAHRLEEIGTASTTFMAMSPCVRELRKALLGEDGRKMMG